MNKTDTGDTDKTAFSENKTEGIVDTMPRNRFYDFGIDAKNDLLFLEHILSFSTRGDAKVLAKSLMDSFGSIRAIFEADTDKLLLVDGMNQHKAVFISALFCALKRYKNNELDTDFKYDEIDKIREFLKVKYIDAEYEKAMAINFDSKGKYISYSWIGTGNFLNVNVDRKALGLSLIKDSPKYVILVHNHPSNMAAPSHDDVVATDDLEAFINSVGVKLVDSIIFTKSSTFAFSQNSGLIRAIRATCFRRRNEPKE